MSQIGYRNSFVLSAMGFFLLCVALIWIIPESIGWQDRYELRQNGELTYRGWTVLVSGTVFIVYLLPHAFHILIRRPALEIGDGELRIWMLPYVSFPLAEISKIEVGDDTIDIFRHGKPKRRINARILNRPRVFFFDDVRAHLANKEIVQEK